MTVVDHGPDLPALELTPTAAYAAAAHVKQLLEPPQKAFDEMGSIEGIAHAPDLDGRGNKIIKIRARLTGDDLTCRLSGQALAEVEARHIGDLWKDCRVLVHGVIRYKAFGQPSRIDATQIRFFRPNSDLPSIEDIQDTEFTGGKRTEEYLASIRDGRIN
jgi:hypothetical protein